LSGLVIAHSSAAEGHQGKEQEYQRQGVPQFHHTSPCIALKVIIAITTLADRSGIASWQSLAQSIAISPFINFFTKGISAEAKS
jgi:hypothetical protein